MVDLNDFKGAHVITSSRHNNFDPLIKLLLSDVPISRVVRDYIVKELQKPAGKRFARTRRTPDPSVRRQSDLEIISRVWHAKRQLMFEALPDSSTEDEIAEALSDKILQWNYISDDRALDWLSENGYPAIEKHNLTRAAKRLQKTMYWHCLG